MMLPHKMSKDYTTKLVVAFKEKYDKNAHFTTTLAMVIYAPTSIQEWTGLSYKKIATDFQRQNELASEHGVLVFVQQCLAQLEDRLSGIEGGSFFLLHKDSTIWNYCGDSQIGQREMLEDIIDHRLIHGRDYHTATEKKSVLTREVDEVINVGKAEQPASVMVDTYIEQWVKNTVTIIQDIITKLDESTLHLAGQKLEFHDDISGMDEIKTLANDKCDWMSLVRCNQKNAKISLVSAFSDRYYRMSSYAFGLGFGNKKLAGRGGWKVDAYCIVHIMMWASISPVTYVQIHDCISTNKPDMIQASPGDQKLAIIWMRTLVHCITCSAFHTQAAWSNCSLIKNVTDHRKKKEKWRTESKGGLQIAMILYGTIGQSTSFFTSMGQDPSRGSLFKIPDEIDKFGVKYLFPGEKKFQSICIANGYVTPVWDEKSINESKEDGSFVELDSTKEEDFPGWKLEPTKTIEPLTAHGDSYKPTQSLVVFVTQAFCHKMHMDLDSEGKAEITDQYLWRSLKKAFPNLFPETADMNDGILTLPGKTIGGYGSVDPRFLPDPSLGASEQKFQFWYGVTPGVNVDPSTNITDFVRQQGEGGGVIDFNILRGFYHEKLAHAIATAGTAPSTADMVTILRKLKATDPKATKATSLPQNKKKRRKQGDDHDHIAALPQGQGQGRAKVFKPSSGSGKTLNPSTGYPSASDSETSEEEGTETEQNKKRDDSDGKTSSSSSSDESSADETNKEQTNRVRTGGYVTGGKKFPPDRELTKKTGEDSDSSEDSENSNINDTGNEDNLNPSDSSGASGRDQGRDSESGNSSESEEKGSSEEKPINDQVASGEDPNRGSENGNNSGSEPVYLLEKGAGTNASEHSESEDAGSSDKLTNNTEESSMKSDTELAEEVPAARYFGIINPHSTCYANSSFQIIFGSNKILSNLFCLKVQSDLDQGELEAFISRERGDENKNLQAITNITAESLMASFASMQTLVKSLHSPSHKSAAHMTTIFGHLSLQISEQEDPNEFIDCAIMPLLHSLGLSYFYKSTSTTTITALNHTKKSSTPHQICVYEFYIGFSG